MSKAAVTGIRNVDIAVVDLDGTSTFYQELWGLRRVASGERSVFLRGAGPFHHVVALHQRSRPALLRVVFNAATRAAVDALHDAVAAVAVGPVGRPAPLTSPGGGYGFGFKDPEGRNFAVASDVADHPHGIEDGTDRPRKITHVNLNAGDRDRTSNILVEVLGFRLIDETEVHRFFCCGPDHHSVVIGRLGIPTLNHVAFETPDLDSLMRMAGRMRDAGYPIEWGIGRHGPGNNVFAYFIGPEEFPLELTSEVLQVDETYQPRGPDAWKWPPGRLDRWGVSDPPSARWRRIQRLTQFTTE